MKDNKFYTVEISETRAYSITICAESAEKANEMAEKYLAGGLLNHTVVDVQYFPEIKKD